MQTEWVTSRARLDEVAARWDELPGPFARHGWTTAWLDAFGAGAPLHTCLLWEGEELVAALPALGTRRHTTAMVNYHSPFFTPPARDAPARDALARALREAGLDRVTVAALPGDAAAALAAPWGRTRVAGEYPPNLVVEMQGSFEEYRERTRPSWMKRLARYRRQMERRHELTLEVGAAPGDLDGALSACFAVEASGWKGRGGTAIAQDPATERFYRRVAHLHRDAGELRLSRLSLDGRLVAFDLALEADRRYYSLKTGYDEAHRKTVPGLVLRLAIVEHCFEGGLDAHELLGAPMDWKESFATARRPLHTLELFGRSPAGLAGYTAMAARRRVTASRWWRTAGARRDEPATRAPRERSRPGGS